MYRKLIPSNLAVAISNFIMWSVGLCVYLQEVYGRVCSYKLENPYIVISTASWVILEEPGKNITLIKKNRQWQPES